MDEVSLIFLLCCIAILEGFGMMISLQRSNDGERLDSRWGYVLQSYLNFSVHRCGDEGSTHNRTRD